MFSSLLPIATSSNVQKFCVVADVKLCVLCSCSTSPEKVPRLPPARGPGLHTEQQDVRDGEEPADAGGGHGLGEGGGHAGHLHEGQRPGGWRQVDPWRDRGPGGRPRPLYCSSLCPAPPHPPFISFCLSISLNVSAVDAEKKICFRSPTLLLQVEPAVSLKRRSG